LDLIDLERGSFGALGSAGLFDEMQAAGALFSYRFNGLNFSTEVAQLGEFALNGLQTLVPLAVSFLGLGPVPIAVTVLLVQILNVGDLGSEPRNLFAEDFQMIHAIRIAHLGIFRGTWGQKTRQQCWLRFANRVLA
jgi:hypothetical protein